MIARVAALSTIESIVRQPSDLALLCASSLAPHYPISVLGRGTFPPDTATTRCASDAGSFPHCLQHDSGLNDLLRAGTAVGCIPQLGEESRLAALLAAARSEAIAAPSGSKPLAIALAEALTDGSSPAVRASKELMRAGFVGDEIEIYNAIAGGHQKLKLGTLFDSLNRLDQTLRAAPPLANSDVGTILMIAALFASEDGAVAQSRGLHEIARHLAIPSELIAFIDVLPGAVLKASAVAKSDDLAHSLCTLCRRFIDRHDLVCCEVSDLAFGLVAYLRAFHPNRESCGADLVAQTRRFVGYEWKTLELSRTATLVNERDLVDLGVTTGIDVLLEAPRIVSKLSSMRLVHGVETRRAALGIATTHTSSAGADTSNDIVFNLDIAAAMPVPSSSIPQLEERTGGTLSQFHPIREVSTTRMERSLVRYFEIDGPIRRQFRPEVTSRVIADELLTTGNYPEIKRQFERIGLCDGAVIDLVQSGQVRSLVELTYLCREFEWKQRNFEGFALGIDNLTNFVGIQLSYARVERMMSRPTSIDIRTVLLAVGYHGKVEQSGYGVEHIRGARGADQRKLAKVLKCSGADREVVERLLLDGVLHVVATSECIVPSGLRPQTHSLIIGRARDTDDTYLTVVVATLPDYEKEFQTARTIITVIVHGSAGQMRAYVRGQLHKLWIRTGDLELVEGSIAGCTSLLEDAGQNPITVPELSAFVVPLGAVHSVGVTHPLVITPSIPFVTTIEPRRRSGLQQRRFRSQGSEGTSGSISLGSNKGGGVGIAEWSTHVGKAIPSTPSPGGGEDWARASLSLALSPVFATELLKDAH